MGQIPEPPTPTFERLDLGDGAWVDVALGFVADHRAVYDAMVETVDWRQNRVFRYERSYDEPRLVGWWSPRDEPPHPAIRDAQRAIQSRYSVRFDGCGFAYYRDELDSVAFHRDRDLRWLDDTVIALVSLGQRRPFMLRPRENRYAHEMAHHGATHDLAPGEGDLIVMGGRTQTAWEHSVPKVTRPLGGQLGGRISLQWRWTSKTGRPVVGASYRTSHVLALSRPGGDWSSMGSGTRRDASTVRDGLARWLASERGTDDVVITRCDVPEAGMSSETFLLDVMLAGRPERLVVRLAPEDDGIFPDYDLAAQCDVSAFVGRHGIPAPVPTLVDDEGWMGAPFVVMPFVDGHVPGPIPLVDPWIGAMAPERRAHLYGAAVDVVARLHRLDPDGVPASIPRRDIDAELAEWGRYLEWYADGDRRVPALHRALGWCHANRPPDDPPASLLWGDVRLGNLIVDEQADVVAVLDWEMTTVGAAEHDLAWWQVLEATQDELVGRRVDGFPELTVARADYERALGRELQHMEWFEVFAMLRSSAIMTRAAIREELDGRRPMLPVDANPVLDLLERMVQHAGGVPR